MLKHNLTRWNAYITESCFTFKASFDWSPLGGNGIVDIARAGIHSLRTLERHKIYLSQELECLNPNTFSFKSNEGKDIHVAYNKFEDGAPA